MSETAATVTETAATATKVLLGATGNANIGAYLGP